MKRNHSLTKVLLWVWVVLACMAARSSATADELGSVNSDRWYVILLGQSRAGFAHETVRKEGEQLITSMDLQIALRRGAFTVQVEQQLRFIETPEGRPIEATSTMNLGVGPSTTTYRFLPDGIEKRLKPGDQVEVLPPIEGEWLTPKATERYVEQQIAEGAQTIYFRTVDVGFHVNPIETTMKLIGEENVAVFGKVVPSLVWDVRLSMIPHVVTRAYMDRSGRDLKTTLALPGGLEFTMLAADEQLAKLAADPPEIMASLLIRPDRPLDQPRQLRSAVFELSIEAASVDLPRTGYQKVVWGDQHTARVVVDLHDPVNPIGDLPGPEHLAVSTMVNHGDEKVCALVAEALGDAPDDLDEREKAQRLREFVQAYVAEKDLSVGFATAGEVARTAQGDCTEHAVLLAAMLRAEGIRSRGASGLIYVDKFLDQEGVFGYHMWTQAWLRDPADGRSSGGRWVDLDATLHGHSFDAAHITLGVLSLSDAALVNDLVQMLPLLGGLQVKVIEANAESPSG